MRAPSRLRPQPRPRGVAPRRGRPQRGLYTVEFAAVASVFFLLVLGAIEVSRLLFTWSALDAITQRGARVAAVCPLNHDAIASLALFGDGQDNGDLLPGLGTANVALAYFDESGAATASVTATRHVQVSITGYTHTLLIPGFGTITAPAFRTTRPAESLGAVPDDGSRQCFV